MQMLLLRKKKYAALVLKDDGIEGVLIYSHIFFELRARKPNSLIRMATNLNGRS